jgi:hypothetical protein
MKKIILFTVIALLGTLAANAQEFKIGINGGLPVGDFSEFDSFTIQADFTYLFEVSDRFEAGPVLSVYHFFGAEVDVFSIAIPDPGDPFNQTVRTDDTTFIPIGGTARFSITDNLILGVDLRYQTW